MGSVNYMNRYLYSYSSFDFGWACSTVIFFFFSFMNSLHGSTLKTEQIKGDNVYTPAMENNQTHTTP